MAIPGFQEIMLPLLTVVSDGNVHNLKDLVNELGKTFSLTAEELEETIPSGQQKFSNRVGWARTYLKKAGLLDYPGRSQVVITKAGKEFYNSRPTFMNMHSLEKFPSYVEFIQTKRKKNLSTFVDDMEQEQTLSPEESIEQSFQEVRAKLADEVLENVLNSSPQFFERLVIDLLVRMGYGGDHENAARAIGKSSDGGIDGIIDEDRLGLDSIYVQAKRYQRGSKIGAHFLRDFVGSLVGQKASKGVFITTADFTKEAVEFISKVNSRVVLLSGEQLANLMIDFGIGVTTRKEYKLKRLDMDYFTEE